MNSSRSASKRTLAYALAGLFACWLACLISPVQATVVHFNSVLGSFDVRLYDSATPLTVANILQYVNDGDFDDSIIHRAENNNIRQLPDGSFVSDPFVIQGGNFAFPTGGIITEIPSNPAVQNEPGLSNLRGTVGLARMGGQINSGTNNWFVNLDDNSFLDTVDEGFTVFGRIVRGMEVVDTIANLPRHTIRGATGDFLGNTIPLHGDFSNGVTRDNFVLFSSVVDLNILDGDYDFDSNVNAADLSIWENNFGSTTNIAADGNGNAVVDGADFLSWQRDFGASPVMTTQSIVPEPSTLTLLGLAAALAFGHRRVAHSSRNRR